ncbi:unnamed protein product [Brachionus calyciflorus]|uniref:ISXO2-like transposase domain-containing protein n=1 Tax=Brachionus calyciflorus TaxID=104777 RepID=A0A814L1K9_9BILA|nr:unnamed protein product [Brachionus calyciflorus]
MGVWFSRAEAETLLSIIYEKCRQGSTIFSDCWSCYNKISSLKDFKHQTVNHSLNFVDPNTGTCTNKIESLWNACKHKFKEMHGCQKLNHTSMNLYGISRFYLVFLAPGQSLEKFEELVREVLGDPEEELDLISDCSDTDSESGFSTNSESVSEKSQVNEVSEVRESDKIFEFHQVCEDEITIEASCSSSSKTLGKDLTDDESDCDNLFIKDKLEGLNIASAKEKNQVYEQLTDVSPKCSKSTAELIKKNLIVVNVFTKENNENEIVFKHIPGVDVVHEEWREIDPSEIPLNFKVYEAQPVESYKEKNEI